MDALNLRSTRTLSPKSRTISAIFYSLGFDASTLIMVRGSCSCSDKRNMQVCSTPTCVSYDLGIQCLLPSWNANKHCGFVVRRCQLDSLPQTIPNISLPVIALFQITSTLYFYRSTSHRRKSTAIPTVPTLHPLRIDPTFLLTNDTSTALALSRLFATVSGPVEQVVAVTVQ